MLNNLERYYEKLKPANRECLLALRDLILELNNDIKPACKYGAPFFYFKGIMLCYFWIEQKTGIPYIGFNKGYLVDHPELEVGNRKQIKILKIDVNRDLPVKTFQKILTTLLEYY